MSFKDRIEETHIHANGLPALIFIILAAWGAMISIYFFLFFIIGLFIA